MASNKDKVTAEYIDFLEGRLSGLASILTSTLGLSIAIHASQGIKTSDLMSGLLKKSSEIFEDEEVKQKRSENFIKGHKEEIGSLLSLLEKLQDAENKMLSESKKGKTAIQITITPDGEIIVR